MSPLCNTEQMNVCSFPDREICSMGKTLVSEGVSEGHFASKEKPGRPAKILLMPAKKGCGAPSGPVILVVQVASTRREAEASGGRSIIMRLVLRTLSLDVCQLCGVLPPSLGYFGSAKCGQVAADSPFALVALCMNMHAVRI